MTNIIPDPEKTAAAGLRGILRPQDCTLDQTDCDMVNASDQRGHGDPEGCKGEAGGNLSRNVIESIA